MMRFGTNMQSQTNLNYNFLKTLVPHFRNTEFYGELIRSIQCHLKMFRWTEGGKEKCAFLWNKGCKCGMENEMCWHPKPLNNQDL